MDINLPDSDGTALIRQIRSEPGGAAAAIVALTGKTSDADRRRIEEAGASAYFSKPVDVKGLLKALAVLLEAAALGSPGSATVS